jgi:predicted phage tail protein
MLRTIKFEGRFEKEIEPLVLDGDNIQLLISGLFCSLPDFKNTFIQTPWVIIARNSQTEKEEVYSQIMVVNNLSIPNEFDEIIFVPEIEGSWFLGIVAFTVLGYGVTYGTLITIAILAAGVAYSLTNQPKISSQHAAQGGGEPISYLYNNPPNVTEAGNPIPLIYGRTRVGGTVLSTEVLSAQKRITRFA